MNRHAKAPSANPAARAAESASAGRKARGLFGLACLCVLGLAAFLGSGAPSAGADVKFLGQGFLPNNRAWEMVSPLDKNGGDVGIMTSRTRAAVAGGAVQFSSTTAFSDAAGTGFAVEYIARRDAAPGTQGWATHAISPLQEPLSLMDNFVGSVEPHYPGELSPDLDQGVFLAKSPLAPGGDKVADAVNLHRGSDLLTAGSATYTLLSDCLTPPAGPCEAPFPSNPDIKPGLAGTSADFGHVIFESKRNLINEASGLDESLPKLYEWDNGTLRLAGVLPGETPAPSSAAGRGAGTGGASFRYTTNTISSDGSRIAFTSPVGAGSGGTESSDLYLRENHASTVHINAEERTPDPPVDRGATFGAATDDLSTLYFATGEQLTDDDPSDSSVDVFAYDATLPAADPHNLTRISVDQEPDDGDAVGVTVSQPVIGASTDGDYVYFVSANQLIDDGVAGVTVNPCDAVPCIFLAHNGALRFVAHINDPADLDAVTGSRVWSIVMANGSRITPDGTQFAFLSDGTPFEQPAYDHGSTCFASGGQFSFYASLPGCAELYIYDATANGGAGELTCVSCNPGGAHLTATDTSFSFRLTGGMTSHLNHPLSEDGRFAFFSTGESLVPEDTNGGVHDVYQYDTLTDQVSLLSSGDSANDALFMDASADGRDVFFTTREQLSGWDVDGQVDLYDARADGGLPEPLPPPPSCLGDACQPAPTVLNDPTPSSSGTVGPGNPNVRKRCGKGSRKVRRGGKTRCVKRKSTPKNRANTNRRASR